MEVAGAIEYVRAHHRAVLATRRRDGTPQLSPIVAGLDEQGLVVVSTRETAVKTHNIRRDPAVSLCVFDDAFFGTWVQLDANAEVVSLPNAMDGLVAYYRSVAGEHPDWAEYEEAMRDEQRVLLRLTVFRAGPEPKS